MSGSTWASSLLRHLWTAQRWLKLAAKVVQFLTATDTGRGTQKAVAWAARVNIALVGRLQVGFRGPPPAGRVEPTPAVSANAPVATRTPTADQFSGQARDNVGCRL